MKLKTYHNSERVTTREGCENASVPSSLKVKIYKIEYWKALMHLKSCNAYFVFSKQISYPLQL